MSEPIVSFDGDAMRSELKELVRRTVEGILNALLEEEADDLVKADRYERTVERGAYRAGHYERGLTTTSGQVTLKMPKLKGMRFATAIIEHYKRRKISVEEAMIEMYLAGVSTRRIKDASKILWGPSVPAATASNLNDKASRPSRNGGAGRLPANTPTSSSTASTSREAGAAPSRTRPS